MTSVTFQLKIHDVADAEVARYNTWYNTYSGGRGDAQRFPFKFVANRQIDVEAVVPDMQFLPRPYMSLTEDNTVFVNKLRLTGTRSVVATCTPIWCVTFEMRGPYGPQRAEHVTFSGERQHSPSRILAELQALEFFHWRVLRDCTMLPEHGLPEEPHEAKRNTTPKVHHQR